MKEDYNGDLYDVYYRDGNGKRQCVCYFGYSKRDAEDCSILKNVLEKK